MDGVRVEPDGQPVVVTDLNDDGTPEVEGITTDTELFQAFKAFADYGLFEVIEYSAPGTVTVGIKKVWTNPWMLPCRIGGNGMGAIGSVISSPQTSPLRIAIRVEGATMVQTLGTLEFGVNQNAAIVELPLTIIPPLHRVIFEVTQSSSPVAQGLGMGVTVGPYLGES